jgi:hypothetical protein
MSLILTQLQQELFQYTNRSPLTTPWALDSFNDPGLQVQATIEECVGTATGPCAQFYNYAGGLPNNQYVTVSVQSISATSYVEMMIRVTDTGVVFSSLPGYRFYINGNGTWAILNPFGPLTSGSGVTVSNNDLFTLAAVGTTIYAYHNSTLLGSVTDTSYSSGSVIVATDAQGSISNLIINGVVIGSAANNSISGNAGVGGATVSYSGTASGSVTCDGSGNFTINLPTGSYTLTPSKTGYTFSPTSQNETITSSNISGVNFAATGSSGPTPTPDAPTNAYLGTVTLTNGGSNPSAGQTGAPYIGCVRIVSGPPSRIGTPIFLGNMTLVSAPPSGFANPGPFLGEVSVVSNAPAGNSDVQLGQVKQVS